MGVKLCDVASKRGNTRMRAGGQNTAFPLLFTGSWRSNSAMPLWLTAASFSRRSGLRSIRLQHQTSFSWFDAHLSKKLPVVVYLIQTLSRSALCARHHPPWTIVISLTVRYHVILSYFYSWSSVTSRPLVCTSTLQHR